MKYKIKKYLLIFISKIFQLLCGPFLKIDKTLVLFSSLNGQFVDNSKYLFLKALDDGVFKVFWIAHNKETFLNLKSQNLPVLRRNLGIIAIALKARFFITTHSMNDVFFVKNKKTTVINLWHGTPLKKMGYDSAVDAKRLKFKKRIGLDDYRNIDYLIASSKTVVPFLESAFKIDKRKILPTGLPRNEILFLAKQNSKLKNSITQKVKLQNNINNDKIALYAPTFRDRYMPKINIINQLIRLFSKWGIHLIVKLHPLDKDFKYFPNSNTDIQELLIASDYLVTDYSSVFFDWSILEKPVILFLYDKKEYSDTRSGFYLNIENFPFFTADTIEEIEKILQKLAIDKSNLSNFALEFNRMGCASCRILKLMKALTKK